MEFLGANPLQNSIDVHLKADYVTNETLDNITAELANKQFIEDITYDNDLVEIMNNNVKKITFWVLVLSAIFTLIAVLLINSSIRLAVYSKRFIIKTFCLKKYSAGCYWCYCGPYWYGLFIVLSESYVP